MGDGEKNNITLKWALGIACSIIAALIAALAIVIWGMLTDCRTDIEKNSEQVTNAVKDIASLRLEMANTLATKADVKELGEKVDHVAENQNLVALQLAAHQATDKPEPRPR
jgi:H+/gluconate symporter-like permease